MTPALAALPTTFASTRSVLQHLAVHVIARRRHDVSAKFGLRATPGGFGTPAFGPNHEVVRVSGAWLINEHTPTASSPSSPSAQSTDSSPSTRSIRLRDSTLLDAATFVGVDLTRPFTVGHDTPAIGAVDTPLAVDERSTEVLASWYTFGSMLLDGVVAELGEAAAPTVAQIWPEHFDLGLDVRVAPSRRVNLGASPGDTFCDEPYLYVGPHGSERPGAAAYWNAPFGAFIGYDALRASDDAWATAREFFARGLALLGVDSPSTE